MEATAALVNKFITYVIDPIMLILFACGFFLFMFGMVEFIWGMKEGKPQDAGKKHMIYGIIGMVIMVSVGGILNFLAGTFGLDLSGGSIDTGSINSVGTGTLFE
ncbi:hypothetical protein FJY93_04720 [Candidatus Kaiserbacteria bacterium]|nr:hypothetical protein [Candidatus Kaiserbacteria bacterium]